MGYRVFTDSHGTEWQTWDVVPRQAERRAHERRLAQVPLGFAERRASIDRRLVVMPRARLGDGLDSGWLCFEAVSEKRRLVPIPLDWQRCGDEQLEAYCQAARPTARGQDAMHRAG